MQLEDYFNFLTPNDIRLKGTRIGIETILYDYIYHAKWVGGIKYKMNLGWVEAWNPTPAWVTLPLTHPTNNCASLLKTPEEIAKTYSSLSLEQVYAIILYYLHEQEKITNYLTELSKV